MNIFSPVSLLLTALLSYMYSWPISGGATCMPCLPANDPLTRGGCVTGRTDREIYRRFFFFCESCQQETQRT
ncbi:hypothetical protein V8C37DRAFT_396434 [Trichoderma ceciliae]